MGFIFDNAQHGLFTPLMKSTAASHLTRLLAKVKGESAAAAPAGAEPLAKKPTILKTVLPGYMVPASVSTASDNELESWKRAALVESSQADYWRGQLNFKDARYKKMARVSRTVLGLPNVSAECERDFSAAKALLSSQRHGMLPETFERKMFLMSNRRLWMANPGLQLPE